MGTYRPGAFICQCDGLRKNAAAARDLTETQLRAATLCPRSGEVAKRSNPKSKEWRLCGHRRAERSYSTFKVRRGGLEVIPLVQGKEQQLRFAGAAVKRYPMSKVRKTQVRRQVL